MNTKPLQYLLFRLKNIQINDPGGWKPNSKLIKYGLFTIFFSLLYVILWVVVNAAGDYHSLAIFDFCTFGNEAQDHGYFVTVLCIGLPVVILTLVTALMDFRCLYFIRHHSGGAGGKKIDRIPLNASIISTILSIPYLLCTALVANLFTKTLSSQDKFFFILIPSTLINAIRNPLIVTCAFKVNKNNQNVEQICKKRRQSVIQDAIERRSWV